MLSSIIGGMTTEEAGSSAHTDLNKSSQIHKNKTPGMPFQSCTKFGTTNARIPDFNLHDHSKEINVP